MKPFTAILLSLTLLIGCASTPPPPTGGNRFELRPLLKGDPLASKYEDAAGEIVPLGDPIITNKAVERIQMKKISEDRYDVLLNYRGPEAVHWKSWARRRVGSEVALVVGTTVRKVFTVTTPEDADLVVITIESVAKSQPEADEIEKGMRKPRPEPAQESQ